MSYNKKIFSAVLAVLTILNTTLPVSAQSNLMLSGGDTAEQVTVEEGTSAVYGTEAGISVEESAAEEIPETEVPVTEAAEPTTTPADLSGTTASTVESVTTDSAETTESSDESVPADDSSADGVAVDGLVPDDSSVATLTDESTLTEEELIGAAAVPSGLYYIYTNQATPYMMCVKSNASTEDANVQLGSYTSSNVRMFYIESTGDGYYYLHNLHTTKYVTVGTKNNVQQNSLTAKGDGQKWFLTKNADGSYQFLTADRKQKLTAVSNKSGANICISATATGVQSWNIKSIKPYIVGGMVNYTYEKSVEKAADGTVIPPTVTIELYGKTLVENVDYTVTNTIGAKSGTITLKGIGNYIGTKNLTYTIYTYPLSEGYYHIYANGSSAKPMFSIRGNTDGNLGNAQLGTYAASNVRLFALERAGEGYYYIRNVHTGKYLTAESDDENANVCQFSLRNTEAQQWKLYFYGCTYRIASRSSGKFLIAPKAKVGANLQLYSKQKYQYAWTIKPAKKYICGGMVQYNYKNYALYNSQTGQYEQPAVSVSLYGTTLQEGVDYTISYNVYPDKGIGQAVLKGIGEYTGTAKLSYVLYEDVEDSYPSLPTDIETYQSDYRFDWTFMLNNTSSKLYLTREGYHASITDVSSCVMCDMAAKKLHIMRGYRTFSTSGMKILTSVSLGSITPKAGEIYKLSMEKYDTFGTTVTLTEQSSGKTATITNSSIYCGRGWGKTKTYVTGSASTIALEGSSTKPGDGIIGIIGDSYTEGTTLREGYTLRYATLLDQAFNRDAMIAAKGGATSAQGLKWLNEYLGETCKPKYMIVEFGMNDTSYSTWLKNMTSIIGILEANGVTPILATVPPVSAKSDTINSVHRQMSKWIIKSGFMYIDFEYVMSTNHDRVTYYSAKLLSDGIHPTAETHQEVVDLFMKKYGSKM